MLLPIFALVQSAGTPAADVTPALRIPSDQCRQGAAATDEVVVCGRRDSQSPYAIGPQPELPPALPDAEFRLADGVGLKLHGEAGEIGGIPANRAMITIRIGF